jgi:uncharacterized membrane protein
MNPQAVKPEATSASMSLPRRKRIMVASTLSYFLHSIVAVAALIPGVQVSVLLLFVAMVIDIVKLDDARGTYLESHFRYRLRSVIIAGLLYAATAPLWILLVLPGFIAWAVISLWFAYRILNGFMHLMSREPIV